MRQVLLVLLLVVGLIPATNTLASAASVAQVDAGGVGIRLLDAPVDRIDDPRAQIYVIDHLALGDTIERRIEIGNTTADPQPVQLYAAGAAVDDDGWTVSDGRTGNELSAMVTVEPTEVLLPPGGTATAMVTLRVPTDAMQREHYGVVWAELAPSDGTGVTVVNRVGVRMYVSIGTGDEPASDFTVDALTAARDADGAPQVLATVSNTGGRALDLVGELTLTDGPGGLTAGPFDTIQTTTLGRDASAPVSVTLDPALPAGPWTATMTVRSGPLERIVEAVITFPEASATEAAPAAATAVEGRRLLVPLALGLLLLVGLVLLLVWRRRRHEDDDEAETAQEPPSDTRPPALLSH